LKLFINFTSTFHLRLQPTAARRSSRFREIDAAVHTLHALLNSACTRTTQRWLRTNNGHLL